MPTPIIRIESAFFSVALSIVLVVYAMMFFPVVKRSFILKTKNRYNSALVIVLACVIAVMISLPYSATTYYLYMPLNYYAIIVAGALPFIIIVFAKFKKETLDEAEYNRQLAAGFDDQKEKSILDTHNFTLKRELKRKLFHLLAILYVATWVLEPLVFYGVKFLYSGIANTTSIENFSNSELLFEDKNIEMILLNGLVVQFFMLICLFIGNALVEIMRLRFNKYAFPMKRTLATTRRSTEIYDCSASMLLLLGLAISSLVLTYGTADRIKGVYCQMAVICIAVFSDMFAALIGRKWGKHKWKMVPGKSKEGTLAGLIVGVSTSMIFVGPILALIGGGIFIFTDLVLDKVKISDNALNPILIGITFKLCIMLTFPMIVMLPIVKIW